MAQLVFVHGVATRRDEKYDQAVKNRGDLFRKVVFPGHDLKIENPYWGGLCPNIDPQVFKTNEKLASFSLGIGNDAPGGGLGGNADEPGANAGPSIGTVGQQEPVAALDAICAELLTAAHESGRSLSEDEIDAFAAAVKLIEDGKAGDAFGGDASEGNIAAELKKNSPGSMSVMSTISDAIKAATDRLRNAASTLGSPVLKSYSPAVGTFLGDVFVYLREGSVRAEIRKTVAEALSRAHAASKNGGGPLILVGHSLGGVVLTDILLSPTNEAKLPEDFDAAMLFTVGSQPGLFASLGLISPDAKSPAPARKPKVWYNVFDPIDPFAFRADKLFAGVSDVPFDSVTGLFSAHSAYFYRPQFYARFRSRLKQHEIL